MSILCDRNKYTQKTYLLDQVIIDLCHKSDDCWGNQALFNIVLKLNLLVANNL